MKRIIVVLAILFPLAVLAQTRPDETRRSRLRSSAICKFADGEAIKTEHSKPKMDGRQKSTNGMRSGEAWIPGEEAPTFVADVDLNVGGQDVPAGSYTLFIISQSEKWTLVVSKTSEEKSGKPVQGYSPDDDVIRADMEIKKLPGTVHAFTIAYDQKDASCILMMIQENTQARVKIEEKKLCWPTSTPLTYQCPDQ
jgi:hypothetical protein